MLVLWKYLEKWVRRLIGPDRLEGHTGGLLALDPQIDGRDLVAGFDDRVGEIELAIEFERARLDRKGARCRAWLRRPVNQSHLNAKLGEPQRQDEAGRACPHDQHRSCH